MDCSMSDFPVLRYLPEFARIHVHSVSMPSSHLILYRPLLLLPSVFPSIRVFSSESALPIRWPGIGASASAPFQWIFRLDFCWVPGAYEHPAPLLTQEQAPHALLQQWKALLGKWNQSRDMGSIIHPETPVNAFPGMLTQLLIRDAGGTVKCNKRGEGEHCEL